MDQFDFDQINNNTPKKNIIKQTQKTSNKNNKNNKNDDFFDFQLNQKPKNNQKKKNNFQYNNLDAYLDSPQKKQINKSIQNKKASQKNKQNQSTLPRLNLGKPPQQNDKKVVKNKMDLSLQQLPQKKVMIQKQQKKVKKQSQQFDYAVYGTESKQLPKDNKKSQLKTNIVPIKQKVQQKKITQPKSSPKNVPKNKQQSPKHKQSNKINNSVSKQKLLAKKITQQNQDQYQEQYEQQIQEPTPKPINNKNKLQQKPKQQKPIKTVQSKPQIHTKQDTSVKKQPSKQSKQPTKQKVQQKQQPITKYKQMVQKAFPQDQNQQKIKKLKPDAVNRLNDKMRQMIKGFSSQLTNLIDKNLMLLRKPQNQIKQQIQGQPADPIQAQIKVLQETKKNNQKILQISQKQLENATKMNQKISTSAQTNLQTTQEIQAFKKYIATISRQISNLKNQIQKQGKKVVKLQQNKPSQGDGTRFKSSLEISQKLAGTKLQFDKNKRKIQQLNQKQKNLEDKISQITQKRNQALQRAQNSGITFCSKQQKKKYEQLKKKRQQLMLFESKHKTSVKSKQTLIQHQMTDLQVLIDDYQKRYELLNNQTQISKEKILDQINKAKRNPKINKNTKQILIQLELFINDDGSKSQQHISSLNYISQNIYKKQYQSKPQPKSITQEKQLKKVAYKNYIQQVAKINQENKAKFTTQRRNSQINPFRKALTPGQTNQSSNAQQKMNRTKQNRIQADKQKQRIWKSSNTQTLIRNPLKKQVSKQVSKSRYENDIQQNPLNNKQIIKLIDKNKQKIQLKQEQKLKSQQTNPSHKKPFTFRASIKDKQLQDKQTHDKQLAQIPKQMQKIQKALQNKRNQIQKQNKMEQLIGVKLKDKQIQNNQKTIQLKPTANTTPFRNLKLKKDKQKQNQHIQSQPKFKLQHEKPIPQIVPQKQQPIKQNINQPAEQSNFKPKRFNLRQKKQNNQGGYMPSARNQPVNQNNIDKSKQKYIEPTINISQNKQKPVQTNQQKPIPKKVEQQTFDPFKKFMNNQNKQQKAYTFANQPKNQPLKLNQNQQPTINIKPRLNLFKKSNQQNKDQKKMINLQDSKKQQPPSQQTKFVNPYAKQQIPKQQSLKIQRQGKIKKANQLTNNTKNNNKNIFGDVEDATTNNNILSLGEPQPVIKQQNSYGSKNMNQQKELNVNDLLGIKKRNYQVDKDLLIDLPATDNKVGIKAKGGGKPKDFFGDLDI